MAGCHVFARPDAVPSVGVAPPWGQGVAHSLTVWARPLAVDAHVLGAGRSPLADGGPVPMGGGGGGGADPPTYPTFEGYGGTPEGGTRTLHLVYVGTRRPARI